MGKQQLVLLTRDAGLAAHWQHAFGKKDSRIAGGPEALSMRQRDDPAIIWVDDAMVPASALRSVPWQALLSLDKVRVVAASSNPSDEKAIAALDAGCAGYCHAFSDAETLRQVNQVVAAGQVWVGKRLMNRLLQGTRHIAGALAAQDNTWSAPLTQREREVANLAAQGTSNQQIAERCGISERTVKAHLSAVFTKLNITDRLQLALRVHGIS